MLPPEILNSEGVGELLQSSTGGYSRYPRVGNPGLKLANAFGVRLFVQSSGADQTIGWWAVGSCSHLILSSFPILPALNSSRRSWQPQCSWRQNQGNGG